MIFPGSCFFEEKKNSRADSKTNQELTVNTTRSTHSAHSSILVLVVAAITLFSLAAFGQTFRGAINGTVTDSSGAVVPNVQVTATEIGTGRELRTTTTNAGQFAFQDIPLGFYKVSVSASGFAPFVANNVEVAAGTIYTLPVKLSVGKETTTVEVSAAALALDTTTEVQTNSIPDDVVQALPMNGRDFTQLVAINPGYGGYAVGGFGSLNGTRPNQMNWQIDGVDNNDFWHNIPAVNQGGVSGIAGVVLPLDSIDEFSAQTQSGAETGRNAGGLVNLVLKSGTNTLHGSAYFYERNEYYSASSPFFTPSATAKQPPKLRNLNYGGSVGGAIVKNKTFYFLTFEKQQYTIGLTGLATEPSDAWIAKAKSALTKYNVAPSPLSATLIGPNGFWPRSLIGGLPGTPNNFFSPQASTGYSYNGTIKLDHNFTDKHRLAVRWFGGQGNQTAPLGGSPALGTSSSNLKDYFEVAPIHVYNGALALNSTLTERLSNQLNFGVNYFNQVFHDFNNSFNTKAMGLFLSPDATDKGKYILGAPNIQISGLEQIGLTPPEGRNDVTFTGTDTLSYTKGAHQMRFGGELRQGNVNEFYHRRGTGRFKFDGSQGPWAGDGAFDSTTKALADFLAGDVLSSTIAVGNPERFVTVNAFNFFFQDNWQVRPSLNVSLGMRYEYFGPLHNSDKDLPVFVPGKGLLIQGAGIDSIFPPDRNNWAPRFGFAWSPARIGAAHSVVVRGGFGVHYDQINMNPFLDFRPPITAASGLEGNPIGPHAVSTLGTNRLGQTSYQWDAITAGGNPVFSGVQVCGDPLCTKSPGQNVFSVNQNFRTPYFYNYNLQVEKGFSDKAVWQIGYIGSTSHKLNIVTDLNQFGAFPTFGSVLQLNSIGTSKYNGLQTVFKIRSWRGLTSQFGYTWSHALDQISEYRAVIADNTNRVGLDYGNGDYDTRHLFTINSTYDIPGSSRGPRVLTHGWSLTTIMNWHSGQPYDEVISGLSTISDPFKGVDHKFSAAAGGTLWLNPAAFCVPGVGSCPTGPFVPYGSTVGGNVARNKYVGPGYGAIDFSVIKTIPVNERVNVQLRAEMFNLLNRINLASGPGSINLSCTPVSKTNGTCQNDGNFGYANDTIGDFNGAPGIGPGEPFNMQLAIKIRF